MSATKGYRWGRKNLIKLARPAMLKAGVYAYRDRRNKKRVARRLWQIQISAAAKEMGTSYSKFMDRIHKNNVGLDRKILSTIAKDYPAVFAKIAEKVK